MSTVTNSGVKQKVVPQSDGLAKDRMEFNAVCIIKINQASYINIW